MSLNPLREINGTNIDYITLNTSERGGILTLANVSGMYILQYSEDPSNKMPLGIQINDVEFRNHARQPHAYCGPRRVEVTCGIVGALTDGDFETDWIFPSGTIFPGDPMYVGPSGMVTNVADFDGIQIGHFTSSLKPDRHLVTFKGLGFSRQYMDPNTKQVVYENNPADRVLLVSEGYIRAHINQGIIQRSARAKGL